MVTVLAMPAKAMFILCTNQYGLGFLALLAALFLLMLSLFRRLRSRTDAPMPQYVSYIKLQIHLPMVVEVLIVLSYLCLCVSEPAVRSHVLAGLGILFLPVLAIYLGCQFGSLLGLLASSFRDKDSSSGEDEDEETKDNNRKD